MSLSRKTFLSSFFMTFLVGLFIIAYFLLLLPGLYTNFKTQENRDYVVGSHTNFTTQQSCGVDTFRFDKGALISLALPLEGTTISYCNTFASGTIEVIDPSLQTSLNEIQKQIKLFDPDNPEDFKLDFDFDALFEEFNTEERFKITQTNSNSPFQDTGNSSMSYSQIGDNGSLMSASTSDGTNTYTNLIAFTPGDDVYTVTFSTSMTPNLTEFMPVLLKSSPMIIAILIFMSLLLAKILNRNVAKPIDMLASQALANTSSSRKEFKQPQEQGVFKVLENALNTMQKDIATSVSEIEQQNKTIVAQHQQQEVFMMNASHQLKTPITNMALLLDAMEYGVGQYQDPKQAIPELKESLKNMKHLVDTIMEQFQYSRLEIEKQRTHVKEAIETILNHYKPYLKHKQCTLDLHLDSVWIETDMRLFMPILDNLIQNAIKYAKPESCIQITLNAQEIRIFNEANPIMEAQLEDLKQPFVRIPSLEEGHGLGLYLVNHLSERLGYKWSLKNKNNGIEACLILKEKL